MLENLWKAGDNDRATVDWRWKSTQREVFDRCSRDSSPFSSLLPSFFFSSPVFSNHHHHHHRKLSWSAKHFFPWIWMRADAWNEARGSSVESFLMTERNDSSNLMEEGRTTTTTPPLNFSRPTFLTSWLISTLLFQCHPRVRKNLTGKNLLEGVGEQGKRERIVLSEIDYLFYW